MDLPDFRTYLHFFPLTERKKADRTRYTFVKKSNKLLGSTRQNPFITNKVSLRIFR